MLSCWPGCGRAGGSRSQQSYLGGIGFGETGELVCAAAAPRVRPLPRVIQWVLVFGGMSVVCFCKCEIARGYWGSFCFEVKGQQVPLLHCAAPVLTLFLF